ncbi:M20 aminoacylase family protein [Falsigemmobacter intermedius]|uniref:M20 aminoacylase family protein n=1 Tax=Falsigemmobacter intermedius TaxID=1553448 RepID=UPI003F042EE8
MPVKNRLAELQPEIAAWRQHLHENPELQYELYKTSAFVEARLREMEIDEIISGVGKTGIVAVIKGRTNTSGRVVLLRADMDALPILEDTGLAYQSKTPGVMHACGHDGHTAMLLGAAKYLSETRNFDGTAVLMFQPAEEGGAGAKAMIDEGVLTRWGKVSEAYGLHNWPGIPTGQFAVKSGPLMAATNTFRIVVKGRGGHAAKPHDTIDPTVIGAQIVLALQTIASRVNDPLKSIVVSVTSFQTSSEAYNVIPQQVELRGTVRTLYKESRQLAGERVKAIAEGTALANGAVAEVEWIEGYPGVVNHEAETGYAIKVAEQVSGVPVHPILPTMGGEDFAYLLEEVPGAYIFMGNGDTAGVHHPAYNFDDTAIPFGSSWLVGMVESRLPIA